MRSAGRSALKTDMEVTDPLTLIKCMDRDELPQGKCRMEKRIKA